MPVLFVLLALAVLVAVALVAAGRWDSLADAPHDRAPFEVADPPIGGGNLDGCDGPGFAVAFRGYRMDQVDAVLDRLSVELATRDARIAELEDALALPAASQDPDGARETTPTGAADADADADPDPDADSDYRAGA